MCGTQDRNPRDLLMHLWQWQEMLYLWHNENMKGNATNFLPDGFSWKTTPDLNQIFWKNYQDTSLAEAKKLLEASHEKLMQIIESHTNEELFEKSFYPWTGGTTLGAYLISATSSHYDWATKLLKKM
jgi:hypothetical protein